MQPVSGLMIAIGAWLVLSIPAALLFAQCVDARDTADDLELPVIPDVERCPPPPHLRKSETVADLG